MDLKKDIKKQFEQVPLLGGMFQGPDMQIVPLDSGTKGLIGESVGRAVSQTPDQIRNQMLQGVEANVSSLSPSSQMISQESARTGQDPYMMSAIQNRYRSETARDLDRFKSQADLQSRIQKGQRMAQVAQSAIAGQQVQLNNFAALSQAYQMNEAARAQVISSVIGLAGTGYMISKLPEGSSRRTGAAINTFNSMQDNFSGGTQTSIGGNSNQFGMSDNYGQF